jgi:hypothetical protein
MSYLFAIGVVESEESGVRRLPIGEEGSVTRWEMVFLVVVLGMQSDAVVC